MMSKLWCYVGIWQDRTGAIQCQQEIVEGEDEQEAKNEGLSYMPDVVLVCESVMRVDDLPMQDAVELNDDDPRHIDDDIVMLDYNDDDDVFEFIGGR